MQDIISKTFRTALSITFLCMTAFGAASHAAEPVKTYDPNAQTMIYELYAGGINAVRAELDVDYQDNDKYRLFLSARTQRLLGKLAPWTGSFESYGWRMNDGLHRPKIHESVSSWRGETEKKTYSYNKDGTFNHLTITEAGVDKSPKELDDEIVQQSIDALTATLYTMENVDANNACHGTSEVFDGKRRFKLSFKDEGTEMLKSSKYNVYSGEAFKCVVEVTPVSGKWHKKPRGWISIQEQGRDKGKLPTIWMAKMSETGPAVPVKMRVKTDYGTLFMHLIQYTNGDKTLMAEKS